MYRKLFFLILVVLVVGLHGAAFGSTILYISFDGPAGQDIPSPLVADKGGMEFLPADSSPSYNAESNPIYHPGGTSARFDGPSSDEGLYRVDPGPGDPLDLQNLAAFTIEVFAKPTTLNDRNIVYRKYLEYWLSLRSDGAVDFYLGDGVGGGGGGEATTIAPAGTVHTGEWYHIAVVFDRSADPNTVMYVDGAEVATGGRADWGYPDVGDHFSIGVMKRTWNNSRARHFTGLIDELRITDAALSPAEFLLTGGVSASNPSPASGAENLCDGASLCWKPGESVQTINAHDIFLGTDFDDVNDATTLSGVYMGSQNRDANCYDTSGLAPGTTYYWRIDEVNDADGDSPWKGGVWQFTTNDGTAFNPNPADGQTLVPLDAIVTWWPGCTADLHDVYFGTDFDDVRDAVTASSEYKGQQAIDANEYDPCDFDYSTWYYWRIDEIDNGVTYKGNVWSFRSRSAITDVNFVAWYKFDETEGSIAHDSSGYEHHAYVAADEIFWDPNDGHDGGSLIFNDETAVHLPDGATGVLGKLNDAISISLWLKDARRSGDNWVFEAVSGDYRVHAAVDSNVGDILWRAGNDGNDRLRWDLDGQDVDNLEGWHQWAFVKNENPAEISIYLDGVLADSNATVDSTLINLRGKKLKIGTGNDQAEILEGKADDFRIHDRALTETEVAELFRGGDIAPAWAPIPRDNTKDVPRDVGVVKWKPGAYAVQHDVYFGTDYDDVNDADSSWPIGTSVYKGRQDPCEYGPLGILELDTTYYWRIDEVNEADANSPWKGSVWRFKVANYLVVDDMESYNQADNWIHDTWLDGFENSTGAEVYVGVEPTNPAHGGKQSMMYLYYNDGGFWGDLDYYSEIEVDTSKFAIGSDWTEAGVTTLTLFFDGNSTNDANERMYVGLEDTGGTYAQVDYGYYPDEDMNDIRKDEWHQWDIALEDFSGVIQSAVKKLYVGFGIRGNPNPDGTPGGSGIVYFDDVRLYLPKCIPWRLKPAADFTEDCKVDIDDVGEMADQWLRTDIIFDEYADPGADGLVGWWKLDEGVGATANDSSASGIHDGTIKGDAMWVPGRIGPHALEFDGGKVLVPDAAELRPQTAVSVCAWVNYPDDQGHSARVVVKGADNKETFGLEVAGDDNLVFQVRDVNGHRFDVSDDVWRNEWIHIAGTFDGDSNTISCYVNGQLVDSNDDANFVSQGKTLSQDANDLAIGNRADANDREFEGTIDDARVYDYALTAAQVAFIASENTGYVPLTSQVDLYDKEAVGEKAINFRDLAVLMQSWGEERLWPE